MNKRIQSVLTAVAFTLTASIFTPNKPAKANPALAIPAVPAFCVSTAMVGCVVIGSVVVAGVLYTVYKKVSTEEFFAVAESSDNTTIIVAVNANSEGHALEKCKKHFGKQEVKVFSITGSHGKKRWFCTDNLDFYP